MLFLELHSVSYRQIDSSRLGIISYLILILPPDTDALLHTLNFWKENPAAKVSTSSLYSVSDPDEAQKCLLFDCYREGSFKQLGQIHIEVEPGRSEAPEIQRAPSSIINRRRLCGSILCSLLVCLDTFSADSEAQAYTIRKGEPNERNIYSIAQSKRGRTPLRILWIGVGSMKGVFKDLFLPGNDVLAVDIVFPSKENIEAAKSYAKAHAYQLEFEQGDGTKLRFEDETFDVVLSTQFLCQDFDPQVVVSEIYRVLKTGGRFGYYEDEEDMIGSSLARSSVHLRLLNSNTTHESPI